MRILLFSGGIDSTCLAWTERPDRLVFIDYGQIPARGELRASTTIADELGISLRIIRADLRQLGSGAMAGTPASEDRQLEFWPFRNQMLITLAAMALDSYSLKEIIIGTVITDRHHADGRPQFIGAMNDVIQSQSSAKLRAPALDMTTDELVVQSRVPISLLDWTFSCHTGEWACGQCNGCRKHLEVKARLERP